MLSRIRLCIAAIGDAPLSANANAFDSGATNGMQSMTVIQRAD